MSETMSDGKYLNADRYIATLENALKEHQLDEIAMLEELGIAAAYCQRECIVHVERVRRYTVATATYLAKAKEMTFRRRLEFGGFAGWCVKHGIAVSTGHDLAKIGSADDPVVALADFRIRTRNRTYDSIERRTGKRPGSRQLARIKIAWRRLSAEEQMIFLVWAKTTLEKTTAAA